jgi:hypothetical protein
MKDLLAASQLGSARWSQGMFSLPRHKSKSSDTLTVFSDLQPPTRIVQPDKQFGLHQVAGKNQVHTTVTSNRRLNGVRKVILFGRIK